MNNLKLYVGISLPVGLTVRMDNDIDEVFKLLTT